MAELWLRILARMFFLCVAFPACALPPLLCRLWDVHGKGSGNPTIGGRVRRWADSSFWKQALGTSEETASGDSMAPAIWIGWIKIDRKSV